METLLTTLKRLGYIILVGAILYGGGYGWTCLFTKYRSERKLIGNYNIVIGLMEALLLFIALLFIDGNVSLLVFKIFLLHVEISLIGCVFYLINIIINWLFPNKYFRDHKYDDSQDYCKDPKFSEETIVYDKIDGKRFIIKETYQYTQGESLPTCECYDEKGSIVTKSEYLLTSNIDEIPAWRRPEMVIRPVQIKEKTGSLLSGFSDIRSGFGVLVRFIKYGGPHF